MGIVESCQGSVAEHPILQDLEWMYAPGMLADLFLIWRLRDGARPD